ncbi:MAG: major facilitator superfamily MFS_1 [uncultured bacterium]|nr:MAG: major facilitator superfamily MFS_1 [uncultured bacterium]
MFPLHFFKNQTFSASIAVGWILNFSSYGLFFILTLYFQHLRNYSALATGFAFLPFLGTNSVGSYLGGKLTSIKGSRLPMMIGLFIGAMGFLHCYFLI